MSISFELRASRSVARSEITSISLDSNVLLTTYRSTPSLSWVDAFRLPWLASLSKSSGSAAVPIPDEPGYPTQAKAPIRAATVKDWTPQRGDEQPRPSTIVIRDVVSGKSLGEIKGASGGPMAVSRDGSLLAARDSLYPERVGVWDTKTGERVALIATHTEVVTHAAFTAAGTLVTAAKDGMLRVNNVKTARTIVSCDIGDLNPKLMSVSADGEHVVSLWGRTIHTWSTLASSLASFPLFTARAKEGWPLCFSPDARYLVCRTEDGFDVMEVATGNIVLDMRSDSMVTAAAFDAKVERLCVGKLDGTIEVWGISERGAQKI